MLGLKKKNFLRRFFESRKNKNILDAPKTDFTEGAGLKQSGNTDNGAFVPRVEVTTQALIPEVTEKRIEDKEKGIDE